MVDHAANTIVFNEPNPAPEKFESVLNFVNRKVKFNKLKISERVEKEFEKSAVFIQKLNDNILAGCFANVESTKKRFVFKLIESIFDKVDDDFKDLNKNGDYRKLVQKDIDDFVKGKNDITKKINKVADKIELQTQKQIEKELAKANQLIKIQTDIEETNEVAIENEQTANAIKREALMIYIRMMIFFYGTTALIAFAGLYLFYRFFLR